MLFIHKALRGTLVLPFIIARQRSYMAMASPPQAFSLDRNHFNQTLYQDIRDLWFAGTDTGAIAPSFDNIQTWFGVGKSQGEKDAMDEKCRMLAGAALESIGPEKLLLPPFTNYGEEIAQAETLSKPFLDEVRGAQAVDEKNGAETALSLVLLLDQMPRNVHRTQEELPLVYQHYDRLAFAFVQGLLSMSPRPMEHPSIFRRLYWSWFLLPYMHSEHLYSLKLAMRLDRQWKEASGEPTEGPAAEYAAQNEKAQKEHLEPLRKFGRYPHRNQALGRANTPREVEYLKTASTFGVVQNSRPGTKDEL